MHMAVMASSLMAKLVGMMAKLVVGLMAMLVMTEMMGMAVMATLLTSMDGNMYNHAHDCRGYAGEFAV